MPVLHKLSELSEEHKFVLSVGSPSVRKKIYDKFDKLISHTKWISIILPNASASKKDVFLRESINIMQFVMISTSVSIGKGTLINVGSKIHHDVTVGNFCKICPMVATTGNCQIGDEVFIDTGACILPNIKIDNGAKIGAGAVITEDVPAGSSVIFKNLINRIWQ